MILKKKIFVAIAIIILIFLSYVFRDAQSELPLVLNLLLGGFVCYALLSSLDTTKKIKTSWITHRKYTVPYFLLIVLLIAGLQIIHKIETIHDHYWLIAGKIGINDLIGIVLAILLFFYVFCWITEQWKSLQEIKNSKIKAELALLKNQINPHFFFNSLNKLYSLIKKDPDAAQDYVLKLSDLMRFTIYDGDKETVLLEDEITYLNNFIDLQTSRYHRDIDIKFEHDVMNPSKRITPLIFIILLENAFKHGVEQSVKDSFIHIKLVEDGSTVIFEIENNFEGVKNEKTKGIGLKNLKERLALLYPNKHELIIKDDENIFSVKLELR